MNRSSYYAPGALLGAFAPIEKAPSETHRPKILKPWWLQEPRYACAAQAPQDHPGHVMHVHHRHLQTTEAHIVKAKMENELIILLCSYWKAPSETQCPKILNTWWLQEPRYACAAQAPLDHSGRKGVATFYTPG